MFDKLLTGRRDLFLAAGLLTIVVLMILPVPAFLLDLFLALNISLALAILLTALYLERPLEFSVFPALLLISTLFRLSMNVASTRLILMHGSQGTDAAGQVIETFGNFVVGGSYLVGIIIFIILVLINFVVITKGSGRIAEVAARFTLDALPGKQMSIDADLNAGLITEDKARKRRKDVEQEADFYGAMDGASKFVRGDAIAGLLITAINILGGLVIGIVQEDMELLVAAENYTLLTIGDGLVSQIPSLVISTSAGLVVTRAASGAKLGDEVFGQLTGNRNTYYMLALILGLMSVVPGMPTIIFLFLGGLSFVLARYLPEKEREEDLEQQPIPEQLQQTEDDKLRDLLEIDLLELAVGYDLVPIVDESSGGELLERVKALRRSMAGDMGFIVPSVHIHDDLTLNGGEYTLLLKGEEIGRGEMHREMLLAIDPGVVSQVVPGIPTKEPAFGLSARWINKNKKDIAELSGYMVVDTTSAITTHLSELVRQHAAELIGRQEAQELVDIVARNHPKLVEELIPNMMALGDILKVLKKLLREQISIRDMRTILETLADYAPVTKDPDSLTEFVRQNLARTITKKYTDANGVLNVLTLERGAEDMFRRGSKEPHMVQDPVAVQKLLNNLEKAVSQMVQLDQQPVLITAPDLRRQVKTFTERFLPQLSILSYKEIDANTEIRAVIRVGV